MIKEIADFQPVKWSFFCFTFFNAFGFNPSCFIVVLLKNIDINEKLKKERNHEEAILREYFIRIDSGC
ncbi:hypothetical protein FM107_17560 [Sphingobacterium sp. JB170]|nr:hypothetical protein FM107_17560 [Sphingobacterium sp. JB170]